MTSFEIGLYALPILLVLILARVPIMLSMLLVGIVGRRAGLPSDVAGKTPSLVKATLEIYNTIKLQLLPTPSKSHYTYNMRDLSKVWQGVCRSQRM